MRRAASPFGLYRGPADPDFDPDVLDEFDDIKTKVIEELRLQSFGIFSQRSKELTIRLGNTSEHTCFLVNLWGEIVNFTI